MKRNRLNLLILLFIFGSILWGCVYSPTDPINNLPVFSLQQAYRIAVADAEIAEPYEIYDNLVAIVESNNSLTWSSDKHLLKVVTWTSWREYLRHIDSSMPLEKEVWVTVIPEIQNFCKEKINPEENLNLRLEQLLGLPPNSGKTFFVEMWVEPKDLFRPSPDPEITDSVAELDFSKNVNEKHIEWFINLKSESYVGEYIYPWTRLGYTYDWGNPKGEIGLSEFVIKQGATVKIDSVYCTSEYCGKSCK